MGRLKMGLETWAQVKAKGDQGPEAAAAAGQQQRGAARLGGKGAASRLTNRPEVSALLHAEGRAPPLVVFDDGPGDARDVLLLKLSERVFLDESIRGRKLLPFVLPMGEFVGETCRVKPEHQPSGGMLKVASWRGHTWPYLAATGSSGCV